VKEAFVSYAQNFEDVILWRALQDVRDGFYIDVGAGPPLLDSVTLAFYERGWHGINVEPDLEPYEELVRTRPRDVTLNVALSNVPGEREMFFVPQTGNSTLSDEEAKLRELEGRTVVRRRVAVRTLAELWAEHVPDGQPVHFLKIDVEGGERQVLEGLDWRSCRPWIVVAEATRPNSRELSHQEWEGLLLDADYALVHRDALNRFYLSSEHSELRGAFEYPPNYWDNFVTYRQRSAELRAGDAESRARNAESRARQAEAELARLRRSRSWRLAAPLRRLGNSVRRRRRNANER
jgi:FkbM family methyltransferase